jgi:hypothetical protein
VSIRVDTLIYRRTEDELVYSRKEESSTTGKKLSTPGGRHECGGGVEQKG